MPKTKNAKSRKTRRTKNERPVIPDAQAAALTGALKPSLRRRRSEFDSAHKDGMDALKRGDYDAVRDALVRERKVIDAQARALTKRGSVAGTPGRKKPSHRG